MAKLKGTPTVRPEGLPEAEAEPAPPPPPPAAGAKPKRKGSKIPAASILSGEENASGSAGAAEDEERWIDYKGNTIKIFTKD